MTQRVKCKISKTIWVSHKAGRYDSTKATCSICNNSTSSYGSGDNSVKRCLALLKESCPLGAIHFYVADVVQESCKYKGTTSTQTYKDGKEFLEFDEGKSPVSFPSAKTSKINNNDSSSESKTIYVRAVNKDTSYSSPIIVHRPDNQSKLPKQFVLQIIENAFKGGDIVQNTELNLYAEYKAGFLDDILKGFRVAFDHGCYITVEETKDSQGLLYACAYEQLNQPSALLANESRWVNIAKFNPEFMIVLLSKYYPFERDIIETYIEQLGWNDWPGFEEAERADIQDWYRECGGDLPQEFYEVGHASEFFKLDLLSSNKSLPWSENFIERFGHKWDWRWLSMNESLPWSEGLIDRFQDRWDWGWLSVNLSLPWSESFVERYADKWRWGWLSSNAALPWSENFILRYVDKWDFHIDYGEGYSGTYKSSYGYLAINPAIPWSEGLLESLDFPYSDGWYTLLANPSIPWPLKWVEKCAINKDYDYAWKYLSENISLPWSVFLINRYSDKWDWKGLSENISLPWSMFLINRYADKWDWKGLSENTALPWSDSLIKRYADKLDWKGLSKNTALPWSESLIERYVDTWDWERLSSNTTLPWADSFIERFADKWNWKSLSENKASPWSVSLIERYADWLDWDGLSRNNALPWSESLIDRYADMWNWKSLSENNALPWSESLIDRYADMWNWKSLSENNALPWSESLIDRYADKWQWGYLACNGDMPWSEHLIERYSDNWHINFFKNNESVILAKLVENIDRKVMIEIMKVLPKTSSNDNF